MPKKKSRRRFRWPLIPKYARLPLFLCLITDLIAYYTPRLMHVRARFQLDIALDAQIPLVPAFSYIYIAAFAFWTVNYIYICRQSRFLCMRLFFADTIAKIICLYFFIQVPCTMQQRAIEDITGPGAWLLKLIYQLDAPDCLLPSIHCFVSWLSFRPMLAQDAWDIPKGYKIFSCAFMLLICASTLFTGQHVAWDVVTGIAAAESGWLLSKLVHLREI